jgi:hypothetical protein
MAQLQKVARIFWYYLREACGENDYARYRARALDLRVEPVPPEVFYLSRLQRKYSRPNRCC